MSPDSRSLTTDEVQLIQNFRAMKKCAKDMLVGLSAQYKRTLPAEPVVLTLVGADRALNRQHENH